MLKTFILKGIPGSSGIGCGNAGGTTDMDKLLIYNIIWRENI